VAKKTVKVVKQGPAKELLEVAFSDTRTLQDLVGPEDQNLKAIQKVIAVKIGRGQTGLLVSGEPHDVELTGNLLEQLRTIVKGGDTLYSGDVERAIKLLSANRNADLTKLFREQVVINGVRKSIVPKGFTQKSYIEAIKQNDLVFGVGPAGTGKTYLAMAMAVAALHSKSVRRIVLCRPAVEAGEKLGFLPGDMAEKVNPYLRPLYDALYDMVDMEKAEEYIEKGVIEVAPLAFMRGRTLSEAFIILDEAQNTSTMQMKMLLTRIGHGSKCVVTGDATQVDLPRGMASGLSDAVRLLQGVKGVEIVNFSKEDVVRHPLVARIVHAYEGSEA
jgi:phosphate starvation-inducible PhoH-like protein